MLNKSQCQLHMGGPGFSSSPVLRPKNNSHCDTSKTKAVKLRFTGTRILEKIAKKFPGSPAHQDQSATQRPEGVNAL